VTDKQYKSFNELPEWAEEAINEFRSDPETWVFEPVPALNGKSFIQVMNEGEDGERHIREYLLKIQGMFR